MERIEELRLPHYIRQYLEKDLHHRPVSTPSLEERAQLLGKVAELNDIRSAASQIEHTLGAIFPAASINEQADVLEYLRGERYIPEGIKLPTLISIANNVRALGMHYKNYHVGAAAIGLRRNIKPGQNPWVVLYGAATKLDRHGVMQTTENGGENWCAEQYVFDEAERENIDILMLTVAGVPRKLGDSQESFRDDASGKEAVSLQPCEKCRIRMALMLHDTERERSAFGCLPSDSQPVMNERTPIFAVNVDDPKKILAKLTPAEQMLRMHIDESGDLE